MLADKQVTKWSKVHTMNEYARHVLSLCDHVQPTWASLPTKPLRFHGNLLGRRGVQEICTHYQLWNDWYVHTYVEQDWATCLDSNFIETLHIYT